MSVETFLDYLLVALLGIIAGLLIFAIAGTLGSIFATLLRG